MVYFPGKKALEQATGERQGHDWDNALQIREKYGAAVINKNGMAQAKIGPSAKKTRGMSHSWELKEGDTKFPLPFNGNLMVADTIAVYRNGGEALEEGRHYRIDYTTNHLVLHRPAFNTDDDLEIRCQLDVTSLHLKTDIIVLPRAAGSFQFTDEQLEELSPVYGDRLSVERLKTYGNFDRVDLKTHKKGKDAVFIVHSTRIAPEGIVADGIIE